MVPSIFFVLVRMNRVEQQGGSRVEQQEIGSTLRGNTGVERDDNELVTGETREKPRKICVFAIFFVTLQANLYKFVICKFVNRKLYGFY